MADTERLPRPVADNWDWQLHAACRGVDVTTFFHPAAERVTPAPAPHPNGSFHRFIFSCGAVETYTGSHVWGGLRPMYVNPNVPLNTYAEHVAVWDKVVAGCRHRLYTAIGLGGGHPVRRSRTQLACLRREQRRSSSHCC